MSSLTQVSLPPYGQLPKPWKFGCIDTASAVTMARPGLPTTVEVLNTARTSLPGSAMGTTWPLPVGSTQWAEVTTSRAETSAPEQMNELPSLVRTLMLTTPENGEVAVFGSTRAAGAS